MFTKMRSEYDDVTQISLILNYGKRISVKVSRYIICTHDIGIGTGGGQRGL